MFVHVPLSLRADLVLSLLFADPDFCVLDTQLRCLLHNVVYTCLPPKTLFIWRHIKAKTHTNKLFAYEMKLLRASLFPTLSASCGCDSIATNEKTNENRRFLNVHRIFSGTNQLANQHWAPGTIVITEGLLIIHHTEVSAARGRAVWSLRGGVTFASFI